MVSDPAHDSCGCCTFRDISELICRFQLAFDLHDWAALRACLADLVFVDYSSFRRDEPGLIRAESYVEQRRSAMSHLRVQHDHTNMQVEVAEGTATVRCNYSIHRFEDGGPRHLHSLGRYRFTLSRRADGWVIDGIEQQLLANEGDPSLHPGVPSGDDGGGMR